LTRREVKAPKQEGAIVLEREEPRALERAEPRALEREEEPKAEVPDRVRTLEEMPRPSSPDKRSQSDGYSAVAANPLSRMHG
jgi:hypothetical protein